MKKIKISPNSIFLPAEAIKSNNRERFSGRKKIIENAVDKISQRGSSLVVYGQRGIGKTSFGWQLSDILSGDSELVNKFNIEPIEPMNDYYCVWLECTKLFNHLEDVLINLFNKSHYSGETKNKSMFSVFPKVFEEKEIQNIIETIRKYDLKIFKYEVKSKSESKKIIDLGKFEEYKSKKQIIHDFFREILGKIKDYYPKKELLIFIDEFDKLPLKEGIGDIIKTIGLARFVIIGIADTIEEIIEDHESVERKLNKVLIEGFSETEMHTFFDKAEKEYPEQLKFSTEFRDLAIEYCDGFPYLAQHLGYNALFSRLKKNRDSSVNVTKVIVDADDFFDAFNIIVSPEGDTNRYNKIIRALKNSPKRRQGIIFALSALKENWVTEKDLLDQLEAPFKRDYYTNLDSLEDHGVLKRRNREVRFTDPIIRAIVKFKQKNNLSFI